MLIKQELVEAENKHLMNIKTIEIKEETIVQLNEKLACE